MVGAPQGPYHHVRLGSAASGLWPCKRLPLLTVLEPRRDVVGFMYQSEL